MHIFTNPVTIILLQFCSNFGEWLYMSTVNVSWGITNNHGQLFTEQYTYYKKVLKVDL